MAQILRPYYKSIAMILGIAVTDDRGVHCLIASPYRPSHEHGLRGLLKYLDNVNYNNGAMRYLSKQEHSRSVYSQYTTI